MAKQPTSPEPGESAAEQPVDSAESPACSFVVGIGASAGGLEALEDFFAGVDSDTGLVYVVVQHLSPDFKSHMAQLLGRHTQMPIQRVVDRVKIAPNHVYLIPARMQMILNGDQLLLTDLEPETGLFLPIDHFFRSIAAERGGSAIGVVLSGTGSDGSRGAAAIEAAGGLVLVQEPAEAKFDSMPKEALRAAATAVPLPSGHLAAAITSFVKDGQAPVALPLDNGDAVGRSAMESIFHELAAYSEVDFSQYKGTTIGRRIQRRQLLNGLSDRRHYAELLTREPGEVAALYQDLLIGVTRFFRDPEAFELLGERLPALLASRRDQTILRIWIAGCATGEEAYSIAILVQEALDSSGSKLDFKIFATDVHQQSLQVATKGVYSEDAVRGVSPAQLTKYFYREGSDYRVMPALRERIVFAKHDLLGQPPFTKIDLLVCRNLLIYFQAAAQKRAFLLFHFAMRVEGLLFLGPSETPGDMEHEFESLEPRWRLFRKIRDARDLSVSLRDVSSQMHKGERPPREPGSSLVAHVASRNRIELLEQLLHEQLPPSVLVSTDFEVRDTFGGFEELLRLQGGRFSVNLLDLVPDALRTALAGALGHVLREEKPVRYTGVTIEGPDGPSARSVTVEPVKHPVTRERMLMVRLESESSAPREGTPELTVVDVDQSTQEHIRSLETDLRFVRENLQATVEELEASNEELQATNEELVAGNEELQSTNEELQSVNEEMFTVNAEHQAKIEEVLRANSDMDNLLASTQVGVIFTDSDLRIRRYTPKIASTFGLSDEDLGRSPELLMPLLDYADLITDMRRVLDSGETIVFEAQGRGGVPYLIRTMPYWVDNRVSGVVLTLIDLAALRTTEAELARFKFISDHSVDYLSMVDEEGRYLYVNEAMCKALGYSEQELLSMTLSDVDSRWPMARYREFFQRVHDRGVVVFQSTQRRADGSVHPIEISVSPFVFGNEAVVFSRSRDISRRDAADRRLKLEHTVSKATTEALTVRSAFQGFLAPFVDVLGVTAAQYWSVEQEPETGAQVLVMDHERALSHDPFVSAWRQSSAFQRIIPGEGLIGNAWRRGEVQWANELGLGFGLARSLPNGEAEPGCACAFPIGEAPDCVGVVAFYLRGTYSESSQLMATVASLGRILSQGLHRLEQQQTLRLRDRAIHASQDGILIADARQGELPLVFVSRGFEEQTGYTAAEVRGRDCLFLQGPNTDLEAIDRIREGLEQGRSVRETVLNYRKDGSSFWNDLQLSPIRGADGKVESYVGVQHDISDRINVEQRLREARQQATAANRAKSEFLANMSHEIRTPMAAILGFSDALEKEVKDQKALEHLGTIRRNGQYLLHLIGDILDLSKVEAGKLVVETTDVDLPSLLRDIQSLMEVRASEEDVQLELKARGKVPQILRTDRTRLRQVLVNLISNAIKFTPGGRVTVELQSDKLQGQGAIRIDVVDEGIGISEEDQKAIFDPFFQVQHEDPAVRREGTGLGLSISKRLVTALGGELRLSSSPGQGSCFSVLVPLAGDESIEWVSLLDPAEKLDDGVEDEAVSLRGVRVLVADDRKDVGRVAQFYLEDAGAKVDVVLNGQEALDLAWSRNGGPEAFEVILMDMQMPILDGFEATRELRSRGFGGKVIALTAGAMTEDVSRCIEAGCDLFLSKPVEESVLLQSVGRLVSELRDERMIPKTN